MIDPSVLSRMLRYDPDSGSMFWLPRENGDGTPQAKFNAQYAGKLALTGDDGEGYRHGMILGNSYRAHRVAWAIMTGYWPDREIDHINGCRSDNSWTNLRQATDEENARNVAIRQSNTSGFKGVHWCKHNRRWIARIRFGGSRRFLGQFDTPDAAAAAYAVASAKYHKNFGRLN